MSDPVIVPETLPAKVPAEPIERVPVNVGIRPASIEEAWRTAKFASESNLVPASYRGKPTDALIAIMMGAELGLAPVQALNSIAVINGRPSVWGDGLLAIVKQSPLCLAHDEYLTEGGQRVERLTPDAIKADTTEAVCTFKRAGHPDPITRSFSVAQAKRAGLYGKPGPWQLYPDRMLLMRARSFAARDAFPDLLRGLITREEAEDTPPRMDDPPAAARVRRLSESPQAAEGVEHVDGVR